MVQFSREGGGCRSSRGAPGGGGSRSPSPPGPRGPSKPPGRRPSGPRRSSGPRRPSGPPARKSPSGRWGRNSSSVNLPSRFRSSFFNALLALAISFRSITPSWFTSSAAINGGGGGRCPSRPGPPGSPGWPGPPGPSRRGGRSPRGGPLPSCAVAIQADAPRASSTMAVLLVVFILFYLSLVSCPLASGFQRSAPHDADETNGCCGQIVFSCDQERWPFHFHGLSLLH